MLHHNSGFLLQVESIQGSTCKHNKTNSENCNIEEIIGRGRVGEKRDKGDKEIQRRRETRERREKGMIITKGGVINVVALSKTQKTKTRIHNTIPLLQITRQIFSNQFFLEYSYTKYKHHDYPRFSTCIAQQAGWCSASG